MFFRGPENSQEYADYRAAFEQQGQASEHNDRGGIYFKQKNWPAAENEFRRAIEINPFNATAHGNIGHVFMMQGQMQEATVWLRKALALDPNLEGVREALEKIIPVSPKSQTTALLLCLFLGFYGAHRFYVGKTKTALCMILTLGGLGIWVLIDLIKIALGKFQDIYGNILLGRR